MAFKKVYDDYNKRRQTRERNSQPENRCCTNCYYYHHKDGGYVCTCNSHNGVYYRMPSPSVAQYKVCSHFYPSEY